MATPTNGPVYSQSYLRYALGLLVIVYTFNFIDRQILVILQESIKQEMGLSDGQLGLLSGFTFAIFYVTLGLPIARIADRGNRRNVISWSIGFWSAMTAIAGFVQSFPQLVAARIGVGIGEAGGSPPAHALISDYFPPKERGRALSIYSMGVYLGVLFGYVAGGWLNQLFGWRVAFVVVGVPGLAIAVLLRLTIREPVRGQWDATAARREAPPLRTAVTTLWSLRSFRYLALAAGLSAFVTYGTGNFAPSFLARTFQLTPGQIGTALGLIGGLCGMAGTYLGGFLGDRLGARDIRWYLWIPALLTILALPIRVASYAVPDPALALALKGVSELMALTFLGPVIAMSHALVAPGMRAFTSSVLFFVLNLVGLGLGPVFTGFLSDALLPRFGADGLRWAMAVTTLAWLPASALYLLAASTLRRDIGRGVAQ
ncbi:MAG: spinster family MFS transporter [Gemmatimonadales bacterium]